MSIAQFNGHVGSDGILELKLPLGPTAANSDVRVTIELVSESPTPPISSQAEWLRFIERTAGSIDDPTFFRQDQGVYEQRPELFP